MIISNILGGLGNQMFQYANSRYLSILHNQPLLLDISDFNGYSLHNGFELNRIFNISAQIAQPKDVERILGWQRSKSIRYFVRKNKLRFIRNKNYILEPCFNYWKIINTLDPPYYLEGYWQSELYFMQIQDIIRNDFSFNEVLTGINKELSEKINSTNSVSLHIRRGDYLNIKNKKIHAPCPLRYYQDSIRIILEQVINPSFFVFSDDINWAKENLILDFDVNYISHNTGLMSYNDMNLMSLCKNNIIANSSFSWWGAWLNANPNKIVIAPKKWFEVEKDTSDLYPIGWILN
ncbi:MAG: alpha-1,2-fucosyltransferase [Thiolinea sp.]